MGAAAICLEMVARGGPIREANQDSEAARRVRIGLSRFESMDSLRSLFGRLRRLSALRASAEPPTRRFSVNGFRQPA